MMLHVAHGVFSGRAHLGQPPLFLKPTLLGSSFPFDPSPPIETEHVDCGERPMIQKQRPGADERRIDKPTCVRAKTNDVTTVRLLGELQVSPDVQNEREPADGLLGDFRHSPSFRASSAHGVSWRYAEPCSSQFAVVRAIHFVPMRLHPPREHRGITSRHGFVGGALTSLVTGWSVATGSDCFTVAPWSLEPAPAHEARIRLLRSARTRP